MIAGSLGKTGLRLLFGLLALACIVNAVAYAATTAGWAPVSDNWYFMDRIIYPYAHGNLHPWDLLVKRGSLDHSQPLRRLLLIANYEWFDLDFRIEALFAVAAGIASYLLLAIGMRRELRAGGTMAWFFLAVLAAVYFSLSAPMVFTWSLLGLGFTSHFCLFLWMILAWWMLESPSPKRVLAMVLGTFAFGLANDDTAIVSALAVVLAAALIGWRFPPRRGGAVLLAIACIVGIGLYFAFYQVAAPPMIRPDARTAALQSLQAGGLTTQLANAWQWALVPLSSAFVHRSTLHEWFPGGGSGFATILLGCACLLAHAWFWWKAFFGQSNRTSFMAVASMLMFYGLVAGILIGRISVLGTEYLWQPRYAFIYRWHILALLMMLVAQWPAMALAGRGAVLSRGVAVALAAFVLALQVPLAVSAWNGAKYVRRAQTDFARQILAMGDDPRMLPPGKCAKQLVVCDFGGPRRMRVVGFLKSQQLSVFSPKVRARNDYPGD